MLCARDARILALRNNIQRYCRLLATQLTDFERGFIHRRLAEDRLALEALEREAGMPATGRACMVVESRMEHSNKGSLLVRTVCLPARQM